jgi:hypothetical protein
MEEEIKARESGTNKLANHVGEWIGRYPGTLITVGMVAIMGAVGYVGYEIEKIHNDKGNRIKKSSSVFKEIPISVQRYWVADMDEDGKVDTILTDSIRYPPLHRGAYENTRYITIDKGDKRFDELYEKIMSKSQERK